MNKVIRSEGEYNEALATLEQLLDIEPSPDSPEGEKIELLSLLVQNYESKKYKFVPPNPIEAIKFRMEQQGLTTRDLIPYIGSRSKVSEVLSGKRPLTMSMIRGLHSGLGIPASVLIQESNDSLNWSKFPIKQMVKLGWISVPKTESPLSPEEILRPLFSATGSLEPQEILMRSSSHTRSGKAMDEYSLKAWLARVLALSVKNPPKVEFKRDLLSIEFMRTVAQFSASEDGPLAAIDFLKGHGINVIVERHLPRTYLDGAAIMINKAAPIVGLTLRYDRIDNFWFTLMHELAHIALHLENESDVFYDDLDVDAEGDSREYEANKFASEALIPQDIWLASPASRMGTPMSVKHLADKLHISPAIIAGRFQHETKTYQVLRNLVGSGEVRIRFPEINWEAK